MINRRDVLKTAPVTAALVSAGQLPLWAASGDNDEPYPIEGFVKILKKYKNPDTSHGLKNGSYKLFRLGQAYGSLDITDSGTKGFVCNFEAEPAAICKATFMLGENHRSGLSSWTTTSQTNPKDKSMASLCSYTETGKVQKGKAMVSFGNKKRSEFKVNGPLLPDWLLPLLAPKLATGSRKYAFSLLREATYFFKDQYLLSDGIVTVPVKGKNMKLKNILHLGQGTLPTNYLVDENNVTVITTYGIVAMFLQSV